MPDRDDGDDGQGQGNVIQVVQLLEVKCLKTETALETGIRMLGGFTPSRPLGPLVRSIQLLSRMRTISPKPRVTMAR